MKKVVILFNGTHLSYSPTVIGLYDLLSKYFDVTILAESPELFDSKVLTNRNVVYRSRLTDKNLWRFYRLLFYIRSFFDKRTANILKTGFLTDIIYEFEFIKAYIDRTNPDFIIAVDFRNLLYSQFLGKKVEFLSLEIASNDLFYKNCSFNNINSVTIQTEERYKHLFGDKDFKTFYIQNAPAFTEFVNDSNRKNLVYCGTAWDQFGFYHCLEFLRKFPEYTLNVKGALLKEDSLRLKNDYQDLISNNRLIIDNEYLDDAEIVNYLQQFRIGFCFYNFELKEIDTFNYHSAPSGKMFKYLAAGVPVVGQNILGLKPIKEFDCGALVEDLKPESIKKAIDKIEDNFEYYSENCIKAARHYSFDKTTKPFIEYLINK